MSPERQSLPVHEVQPQRSAFDLEQLEAADIVCLYTALEVQRGNDCEAERLLELVEQELQELPTRDLEKAREVFHLMAAHENEWVRSEAADLAGPLLRHDRSADYASRQEIIDAWLGLLNEERSEARGAAAVAINDAVNSDWLAPDIASYLRRRLML